MAFAALSLSACTSTENLVTDLISSESRLPAEARTHEALANEDLMVFGEPGLRQFEMARRFEAGTHGFPVSLDCALAFYRVAGQTRTVLREDRAAGGSGQRITYLGFPPGRAAARRLEAAGVTGAPAEAACLSAIQRPAP
ncbi:hypothetical protein [Brevundimonas naejangsanensis]|uniref:hypothetical protein n=1 Tax=Brevundimonas naejangsanensis TaxID=588932 RepID=UPI0013C511FE|nr:hypothetical protein [Brevundimonas naejangsanensis]